MKYLKEKIANELQSIKVMDNFNQPRFLFFGVPESLLFAGLKLDDVFILFDGLDELPDVLLSVFSVLDEIFEFNVDAVQGAGCSSLSLESSLESLNGIVRIWEAR